MSRFRFPLSDILDDSLQVVQSPVPHKLVTNFVQFKEELVDVARKVNETAAGQALYTQFQKLLHEQQESIKQLQEKAKAQKDPVLLKRLEADQLHLEAELQKTWDEMDKLKVPFLRRAALFFSKKTQSHEIDVNFLPS
ncbi:hypothetical protein EDC04DRAFT_2902446 [Pisolithus marmoratus]|nr:hypothetical protein EDC04DRAFT_2902446 [Pisolithus marmoratus]